MSCFEELETGDFVKIHSPDERWTMYGVVSSEPHLGTRRLCPSCGLGKDNSGYIFDTDFIYYEVHVSKQGLNG